MARAIRRTALGAATAALLAVTTAAPTHGAERPGPSRTLTGSRATPPPVPSSPSSPATGSSSPTAGPSPCPARTARPPSPRPASRATTCTSIPRARSRRWPRAASTRSFFNVTGLVRQGYDDAHSDTLPLIATYDRAVTARSVPRTPRGAERDLVLDSIDGVALDANKKKADDFWADVSQGPVKKLWLDAKVEATLDRSTKQVHAPEAWAAGYDGKGTKVAVLDTGVDAGHPDLEGRITASQNFTDSADADDHQGHGTHTTSTVGGTGAASGGKKKESHRAPTSSTARS